ncbi:MAG: hypothetical protein ACW9XH_06865 [Candidatus Nitrosopumilus sp. bin_32a]
MRDYNPTESICDQAALVSAISKGWKEWFSNPTAGPWKRIGIPGVSSLSGTGFEKEETRPDLILYYESLEPKILIIESKDNIDKLIDSATNNFQVEKTCKVFLNIKTRLHKLIESSGDEKMAKSIDMINFIPGYVIGYTDTLYSKIPELKKLHFKFIDKSVFPYFIIIIVKKSGFDLTLETQIVSETQTDQIKKLEEFFQTGI